MRELHVVGVSDDGTHVLLAGSADATRATHQVPVDARLHAAVRGEDPTVGRVESALTPRDIQARLRAGDTVEAVAKAAGVPVARVARYAGPVESERERVVEEARAAVVHRARGESAREPLGEVVDTRLPAMTGWRPDATVWSARRREDGAWVVALDYVARGARHAEWLWHPANRSLMPLDAAATRLSAAPPSRKRRPARRTATSTPATRRAVPAPLVPPAARAANGSSAADRGSRVAVPSWDDVLLGVASPAPKRRTSRSRSS